MAIISLAGSISPAAAEEARPAGDGYRNDVRPLLRQYCLDCHSTGKQKGDLDLERFTNLAEVLKHPRVWQGVVDQITLDEMPPKDKPQPAREERSQLLGWIDRALHEAALARAGDPPAGIQVETRGQIPPMREMQSGLSVGIALAVVAVFLLLTANFQSPRLALVTVSTAPAVVAGVVLMLWLTGTTLNIQSFISSIMSIGVAMANAILLVTFAEERRRDQSRRPAGNRGADPLRIQRV